MQIYVKNTSNCNGLPLTNFEEVGETWTGEEIEIPFADEKKRKVVGWTDLFSGQPCPVSVTKVKAQGQEGFLIHGGNSGVRVLDKDTEPEPGVDEHLPRGWGQPLIWVESKEDLPADVREKVNR